MHKCMVAWAHWSRRDGMPTLDYKPQYIWQIKTREEVVGLPEIELEDACFERIDKATTRLTDYWDRKLVTLEFFRDFPQEKKAQYMRISPPTYRSRRTNLMLRMYEFCMPEVVEWRERFI